MAEEPKGRVARTRRGRAQSAKKRSTVTVSLRIPVPMLKEIDKAVQARPYKIPRHSWLLEAVYEKLGHLKGSSG
jgi:hypothetical protein